MSAFFHIIPPIAIELSMGSYPMQFELHTIKGLLLPHTTMSKETFPIDMLPPLGEYDSCQSLLEAINSWAKPRGYAFTTLRSKKTTSGR